MLKLVSSPTGEASTPALSPPPPDFEQLVAYAEYTQHTQVAYYVPAPIDDLIEGAIAAAEAALAPAGRRKAYEALKFAVRLLSAKMPDNDILSGYAAILGDLPEDLLPEAMRKGLASCTYHKLPPPGVFVQTVEAEVRARRSRLDMLKRHRTRVQLATRTRARRPAGVEAPAERPAVLATSTAD